MGRGRRTLRTYGKHRQRVISSEVWSTSEESEGHVFSTSSSFNSSCTSTDSIDSAFSSGQNRVQGKGRGSSSLQRNKENLRPKRNLQQKKYGSDGESDYSGKFKGKRKRVPNNKPNQSTKFTETPSYNFSEFDDYSLVISSPSRNEGTSQVFSPPNTRSHKNSDTDVKTSTPRTSTTQSKSGKLTGSLNVETSTPCAKRTCRTPLSEIPDNNLSLIDHVEESPQNLSDLKQGSVSELCGSSVLSSFVKSPAIFPAPSNDLTRDSKLSNASPVIKLLQENFDRLHVSLLREKSKSYQEQNASESLFSSINDTGVSEGGVYHTAEEHESSTQTEEEEDEEEDESTEEDDSSTEEAEEEDRRGLSDISEGEEDESDDTKEESDGTDIKDGTDSNESRYMLGSDCGSDVSVYVTADSSHCTPERPIHRRKSLLNASLFNMITPKKTRSNEQKASPRKQLLDICEQDSYVTFNDCIPARMMRQIKKVGEGVYGEVFTTKNGSSSVALKIIPIEGDFPVNDEKQKTFEEILPEIVISQELSLLRNQSSAYTGNFCEVRSVSCVQGSYPPRLIKEWDKFDEEVKSENDRPDVFDDNQLFILFEFANGGRSLESCELNSVHQAKSVLVQTAFSLAVAEEALEFEHRDLHWGNVLVKPTHEPSQCYRLLGREFEVDSHGVEITIIDFTLSRLKKDGSVVYIDLSTDDTLFEGTGDYQFDIYRMMKEENKNKWSTFHPRTNVFWIHYLADKLIRSKRYKQGTKADQAEFRRFRNFVKDILDYSSACELVTCSEYFRESSS